MFVAEIGEVDRFNGPAQLTSWAGLTPPVTASRTSSCTGGRITKQGSTLVRWAAVEAAHGVPHTAGLLTCTRARIAERRGRNIATVAVARKLLTLVYYGLRDGHIRALRPAQKGQALRVGRRPSLDPDAAHTRARRPFRKTGKTTSTGQNQGLDRPRSFMDDRSISGPA